jgi:hypothetical protein
MSASRGHYSCKFLGLLSLAQHGVTLHNFVSGADERQPNVTGSNSAATTSGTATVGRPNFAGAFRLPSAIVRVP